MLTNLPPTSPRNNLQFFLGPKLYGFMYTLPNAANLANSVLLIFASILVSPLRMRRPCHVAKPPRATKTPIKHVHKNKS